MQERAALLGGTLVLRSAPGKGAMVILEFPRVIETRVIKTRVIKTRVIEKGVR
jgi:hypothetical protein